MYNNVIVVPLLPKIADCAQQDGVFSFLPSRLVKGLARETTCKLSCTTVILISGHTKKGGHVPEMPTPRSTTGLAITKLLIDRYIIV